jgi:hypothetical protein
VDAPAGERVEIRRQRRHQGLAFAGLHLGDLAVVEHHAADQLHVEVAHAQRTLGRLAHHRKSLREQLVEGRPLGVLVFQFIGFSAQLRVRELRHRGLEGIDLGDRPRVLLEQAFIAAAEHPRRDVPQDLKKPAQKA